MGGRQDYIRVHIQLFADPIEHLWSKGISRETLTACSLVPMLYDRVRAIDQRAIHVQKQTGEAARFRWGREAIPSLICRHLEIGWMCNPAAPRIARQL